MGRAQVVGREAELRLGHRWLTDLRSRPSELVLVGEAGIGKTTVWTALLDAAARDGAVVSRACASASESRLAFAVLGDLLEPLLPAHDDLPPPQRRSLRVALLLEEASPPPDLRAVAIAALSLLHVTAASVDVVLGVDDLQWVDESSRQVIEFVRHRLPAGAGILATKRRSAGEAVSGSGELWLGPLSLGALHHVVRQQLATAPPRPILLQIEKRSRGNPIVALELARSWAAGDRPTAAEFHALVRSRLSRLPVECRRLLVVLAASGGSTVNAAVTDLADSSTVGPGLEHGLLHEGEDGIRFAHPLFSECVLEAATFEERRSAHHLLAGRAATYESRGRHLALASPGPDDEVAASLDRSVEETSGRGAIAEALELAALAVHVSPLGPARAQRQLTEAELAFRAGDSDRAIRLAEEVAAAADGRLATKAMLMVAGIHHEVGGTVPALRAARAALDAADDDELTIEAHLMLVAVDYEDFGAAARHAFAALELAEQQPDPPPRLLSQALAGVAGTRFGRGEGLDVERWERALALEALDPPPRIATRVASTYAWALKVADQLDDARVLLLEARQEALLTGDDSSLTYAVGHLPQLEIMSGRWTDAERWAHEHLDLAEQMGQTSQRAQALYNVALVHAHRGRLMACRDVLGEGLSLAAEMADDHLDATFRTVAGLAALSEGDAATAEAALSAAVAVRRRIGFKEPGLMRSHGDLAESLVLLGRLAEATALVDELEAAARRARRRSALAQTHRCRAEILAASQAFDAASALARQSTEEYGALGMPFDAARSVLVLGKVERRAKHRAAARELLQDALDRFTGLGALKWSERAAEELARVGGRRHAATELTDSELQVATLAARGMTNREVAAQLFVSPKTVEANLARAYRKLGIASRAELGARLGGGF